MSRTFKILILTICLLMSSGCKLMESLTNDIGGWDLSACVSGFDTCWELFIDNANKFEDGFVETMNSLPIE